ncbi:hypothetical protein FNB79_12255 [Formosa sediminum]|uniref:SGNH/GDSL hydrolase family protein n=1 Tax=Formosa sediminum TaxID=2594004 RepID=A0A516GTI2_9FLAO|nr:hypothetical protein [Formosa sediminum]QDO94700.1 hypothetical protein FNB79_12255 [Formosa sediminum]
MKKLLLKMLGYAILILISLEIIIRVCHLTKDYPVRFVDEYGVEKWVPNQDGYSVTGIRRQNFSQYHINNSGFNSYREFTPTLNTVEIALVGDSFIEGFHQNYLNSIGRKLEDDLTDIQVYEYGYAGYDFADQLHLIHQYKSTFDKIDYVILGLKFENDLQRGSYTVKADRMKFESPMYKNLRQIKLLVYLQNVGALDDVKHLVSNLGSKKRKKKLAEKSLTNLNQEYIKNFETLVNKYGYDKTRFVLLIDKQNTAEVFLNYLETHAYKYLDFSESLSNSKTATNLIYDKHWNNHGRTLVAKLIATYIAKEEKLKSE